MTTDGESGSSMASANEQVMHAHRKIHRATRQMASAPDLVDLVQRLLELRTLITPHFTDEEKPDGFFDLIRARSGRHLGTVKELEDEHRTLLGAVDGLAERARACLAGPVAQILKDADDLARRFSEHEARENALLIDALYVDIGEED